MRVSINLATRPFADLGPALKRLRITMAALAVVAIGLGLGLHALHSKAEAARSREHSLDGDIARITNERQGYDAMMRQPDNAQVLDESTTLNRLFDEKAFSWTLAMEDLETVLPGGVQVTTLDPTRSKNGDITLHLRVIGPRNKAVDLVQNLEHSRRFLHPRIGGESAESNGGPGEKLQPVSASNLVNFEVLAEYNPAAPSERKKTQRKAGEKEDSSTSDTSAPRRVRGSSTTGPGLRRPPFTGTSRPPAIPKPRAGERP